VAVVDREVLMLSLRQAFGGTVAERRAVARTAGDLADDGRVAEDLGVEVTPTVVVENLGDAPEGTPAERWNWWMGALEAAYGGYYEFRVTAWERD
jgi:hypothetical protein